jgi:hypothetical protein
LQKRVQQKSIANKNIKGVTALDIWCRESGRGVVLPKPPPGRSATPSFTAARFGGCLPDPTLAVSDMREILLGKKAELTWLFTLSYDHMPFGICLGAVKRTMRATRRVTTTEMNQSLFSKQSLVDMIPGNRPTLFLLQCNTPRS